MSCRHTVYCQLYCVLPELNSLFKKIAYNINVIGLREETIQTNKQNKANNPALKNKQIDSNESQIKCARMCVCLVYRKLW